MLEGYGKKYNRYNSVFLREKLLFARAGLYGELPNYHMYFGLQNQLKGRVASEGINKLSIDNNWTDFLMLWEYNYLWYENPWQALKNAMENKTILMRNEKCSNPAAVMSG